jgi:hypothetical protein
MEPLNKWQHDCDCSFIKLQLLTKPAGEKWIQYDGNHLLLMSDGVSLLPNNECTGPVSDVYRTTVCLSVIKKVSFIFRRISFCSLGSGSRAAFKNSAIGGSQLEKK